MILDKFIDLAGADNLVETLIGLVVNGDLQFFSARPISCPYTKPGVARRVNPAL
jgi:hypothetical protein